MYVYRLIEYSALTDSSKQCMVSSKSGFGQVHPRPAFTEHSPQRTRSFLDLVIVNLLTDQYLVSGCISQIELVSSWLLWPRFSMSRSSVTNNDHCPESLDSLSAVGQCSAQLNVDQCLL